MKKSVSAAIALMKSMTSDFGHEVGVDMFDKIREVFPEDFNYALFCELMDYSQNQDSQITIKGVSGNKVAAIKAIRAATGMGLKDAVDAVNSVIGGVPFTINLSDTYQSFEASRLDLKKAGINFS